MEDELVVGKRSAAMARRIGEKIGDLVAVDETLDDGGWATFVRIRVAIDVLKPLRRVVPIRGSVGIITGRLSYERPPLFCRVCGLFGHGELDCEDDTAAAVIESGDYPYGPWLCASPLKRKPEAIGSEAFKKFGVKKGSNGSYGASTGSEGGTRHVLFRGNSSEKGERRQLPVAGRERAVDG
ncbi:Zinc knuckle CX2CX4HX4C [Corchorus olitorius]|uniref:Zinc knuckle CX2CX4HX4C n=1 Tax=Corchorus olitorius TaxID=93759 RepID=A0A1R3J6K0_9ROSI|nr:Zinc knuckle CX2CX4HX4C [Corchorus olitorius]